MTKLSVLVPTRNEAANLEECLRSVAFADEIVGVEIVRSFLRSRHLSRLHGDVVAVPVVNLPAFLARYPQIALQIGQGDRLVDLVREGVDCVIRAGEKKASRSARGPSGMG